MTEAKIEKGTEKVYRVTGMAKGGKPGSSTRSPCTSTTTASR